MKSGVFRHLIFNYSTTNRHKVYFLAFVILSARIIHEWRYTALLRTLVDSQVISARKSFMKSCVEVLVEHIIDFTIVGLVLRKMSKRDAGCRMLFYILVISSHYYLILLFMIVWEYSNVEYYLVIEILVFVSNSLALSIATGCRIFNVYILLIVSKCISNSGLGVMGKYLL
jgi:hypothetical protein